jgi:hypothetical protein
MSLDPMVDTVALLMVIADEISTSHEEADSG